MLLSLLISWFFWGTGLTSFWSSTIALLAIAGLIFYFRQDLILNGLLSGALMALFSLFPYYLIILLAPSWVATTYDFSHLSGVLVTGIPIEELVFWFLTGLVFGPFYEYWQCEYLRKKTLGAAPKRRRVR